MDAAVTWRVERGDCVDVMRTLESGSVDAVVCDPPYGLEFMNKDWDRLGATVEQAAEGTDASHPFRDGAQRVRYGSSAKSMQDWHEVWAREALRVLKPGGHLLAFGGTRTFHRLASGVEDAGFEIRDCIAWMYGSGFPKSLNVSVAIDDAAGAAREVVGFKQAGMGSGETFGMLQTEGRNGDADHMVPVTAPATPEAERWEGWGTALKPSFEPVVVARKPLAGTVAQTVLKHGTGALNIDGCRIATDESLGGGAESGTTRGQKGNDGWERPWMDAHAARVRANVERSQELGRWPANVALGHHDSCCRSGTRTLKASQTRPRSADGPAYGDENGEETVETWDCHPDCPVRLLDEQSGASTSRVGKPRGGTSGRGWGMTATGSEYDDAGGASRFFYTSKTSTAEREAGLFDGRICFCERPSSSADESVCPDCGGVIQGAVSAKRNIHPT